MKINELIIVFFFSYCLLILAGCNSSSSFSYNAVQSSKSKNGMVVSAHPIATEIGLQILKKGGNAIDAAVAVQFALAVVYPRAGNLGGGGFMVYRDHLGNSTTLDYREKAPQQSSRNMYLDQDGNAIKDLSREGALSVGVPGTVHGLISASEKYGLLGFRQLIEPAIKVALEGFRISKSEAERLNKYLPDFKKHNASANPFTSKEEWNAGDVLLQKELANTLKVIQTNGIDGFYKGDVAKKIIKKLDNGNGIMQMSDLADYKSIWRKPIHAQFEDYKIISMPPPSSGGIALGQLVTILDHEDVQDHEFQSAESIHLVSEAERRVYADRAEFLGDEDFYPVPKDSLLSAIYLQSKMEDFEKGKASLSDSILAGSFELPAEGFQTTHTSIIDSLGNAVAITTTLNLNYGSKVFVDGAGFFLNDEMDDFSVKPGEPNFYGLIGAEANAIEPGKRMLSSMTPTIIEKDDKVFMVLGTPGGSTIITSVLQVFLNVAVFNQDLKTAVDAYRFHHQWLPDRILLEEGFPDHSLEKIKIKGHAVEYTPKIGCVKAIHVLEDGTLHGAGDRRNEDDCALGY